MTMTTAWTYKGKEFTEAHVGDAYGFVYCITNLTNNRKYIGKKLTKFNKTKFKTIVLKNGKKKKKKIHHRIQSDWQTYWGSNDLLRADVRKIGENNFTREILQLCGSRGECSYWENYYIFQLHALLSSQYYNQWTSCKIHRNHLKNLTVQSK